MCGLDGADRTPHRDRNEAGADIYSPRVRSQGLPDGQSLTHNEDRLSVPPPSQPPNRNVRQPQSSTGKLAYVIFGDQTTGVYYNWNACSHKLKSYSDQKPRNYGYPSYDEAEVAWEFYLKTGVVPYSPANGGVSATPIPITPHRNRDRNRNFADSRGSPDPATSQQRLASSPLLALDSRFPLLSQPRTLITQQPEAAESSFFVVFVGYSPGVYTTRYKAVHAAGSLSDETIQKYTTRHEANQAFVDAFMTDRISRR